ncbi:MAG: tyrosine--tRNA ligase [Candidatus Taylorbacteria bacterium RIFCSPLOWO2_02_FULL_43_11]|uniref:Tyrosine--tRNA ligase n=1 Tax=Candidatus Taylorbacteria bacterium RIFCSPHIGHO2_02_FULL_43_32b TaxID=1802306 RepID=A0A1G2MJM5_9BACT|nr:MAG: tyrosine--tRNA ligase [Candidatus Taylorbacteria bacterium RIFCSPHIGHO2_01_FULL_43_47]OHA24073.1 MAG: tyrosine--tRNA ligase [Candidatus Taylorbacteria bacterium RIFCSPHIGHO2_02_FULL_43_32b]OHA31463.1 MAG: tyrosine--tRNA ligase [Candidatus Taylorbacteria bacterium RIFCSPLOWO2_01_FULL_43_44]OHA37515.1 MAG: tyrosine--tRNA ligase [Candidatus Taylorbacteria bacterium RIFCSPLOWO2_02_FULL_43_11]
MESKEQIVDELLTRSIFKILPSKEEFKSALLNRRLKIYIGADATASSLHLGHATNFMILEKLRKLGHEIIVLFGDFTARIGDPTEKESVRKALSKEQVESNIKGWRKQVGKVLDFKDKVNPAKILKNSAWLSKLTFEKIIEISANFTAQQMLERDMFEKRLADNQPIYFHEFFYPLMQGYDSVVMDVDVEMGGSDQIFNMLVGRQLQKKYNSRDKFVVATTLLANPKTGKKLMSKSEGSYIALDDSPEDMFGKTMKLPDEVMMQVFVDCTFMTMVEIKELEEKMKSGLNPRDVKLRLAEEIVTIYHGKVKARAARKGFVGAFSEDKIPEDVATIEVSKGSGLMQAIVPKIVVSNTDFRRLIAAGSIKNMESGQKVSDPLSTLSENATYKIGKHRFVKIVVK